MKKVAYLFSPSHPFEPNGIGSSVLNDLIFLKRYYHTIYCFYSGSIFSRGCQIDNVIVKYVPVHGSHRFTPIYNLNFLRLGRLFRNCRGDMFFYCWHTPFTDFLAFYKVRNYQNVHIISHGTFCSLKLLPNNPSLLRSVFQDLVYRYFLLRVILNKSISLSVLSISLVNDDRFSDLKVCLKYFPTKLRLNPNIPFRPDYSCFEKIGISNNCNDKDDSIEVLEFILITRITRQKGLHMLYRFAKILRSRVHSASPHKAIKVRFHIITSSDPHKNLPFRLGSIVNLSDQHILFDVQFHYSLDRNSIDEFIRSSNNLLTLSLSRTECEPYSITEPLRHGVPALSLLAGNITSLPGVHVALTLDQLASLALLYVVSPQFREYTNRMASNYAVNLDSKVFGKNLYFADSG